MAELEYTVHNVAVTPNQKRGKEDYAKYPSLRKSKAGLKRPNSTAASKKCQHMQKVRAFMLLGGKCYRCGDNRMQALELDHINGGGSAERKKFRGHMMINEVRKRPFDFQLLCGSCHNLKTGKFTEIADLISNIN